jgi:hypothetical protein
MKNEPTRLSAAPAPKRNRVSAADVRRCNEERAAAARIALAAYCRHTGADDDVEGLKDLLADLGHLASLDGADFLRLLEAALRHWAAETRHPDGLEAAASVPFFEVVRTSAPRTPNGRRRA